MFSATAEEWHSLPVVLNPRTFIPMRGDTLYDGSMQARFRDWVLVEDLAALPFPAYHLLPMFVWRRWRLPMD